MALRARALLVVAAAGIAGCPTDPNGHLIVAMNKSDRDLIVDVATSEHATVRLPAHSRGWLSTEWDSPQDGWTITVRDVTCAVLVTLPVKDGAVLVANANGSIEL